MWPEIKHMNVYVCVCVHVFFSLAYVCIFVRVFFIGINLCACHEKIKINVIKRRAKGMSSFNCIDIFQYSILLCFHFIFSVPGRQ